MAQRKPVIYFIQPANGGPVKIGCSTMPAGRLAGLSAWSPYPLALLATAPGDMSEEYFLHQRFSANRSHGEWFFPTPELMAFIDEVKRSGSLPANVVPVDLSWKTGYPFDWISQLGRILKQTSCSRRELARGVGVTPACVAIWCDRGVSYRFLGRVIEFFRLRGAHLSPQDFFVRKSKEAA